MPYVLVTALAYSLSFFIYSLCSLRAYAPSSFAAMTQILPFASLLSDLISFLVVSMLLMISLTVLVICRGVFFSKALFAVSSFDLVLISLLQYNSACPCVDIRGLKREGVSPLRSWRSMSTLDPIHWRSWQWGACSLCFQFDVCSG